MMELPEAASISKQIAGILVGKKIASIEVEHTPHKLAWYFGDRSSYSEILVGKAIGSASNWGGFVEIEAGNSRILFGEGVNIRYNAPGLIPQKRQLLIGFDDGSSLSGSVQMYGGMGAFLDGTLENQYYLVAKQKPSPLSDDFDIGHFMGMVGGSKTQGLSLKAFLATEQRIPGLGNGVLQDILFNAGHHPKRKLSALDEAEKSSLFIEMKGTLRKMAEMSGRDTELDLFGMPGKYRTVLSRRTVGTPCPKCGSPIQKEAYMGGAIYFCPQCQIL